MTLEEIRDKIDELKDRAESLEGIRANSLTHLESAKRNLSKPNLDIRAKDYQSARASLDSVLDWVMTRYRLGEISKGHKTQRFMREIVDLKETIWTRFRDRVSKH